MTNSDISNKRCRKCGSSHLKIYADGSGYCLDCNDTFADVNDYGQEKKNIIYANENIFSKRTEQPVVSKWKDPQQYVATLTILYFIFGLGFLVIGIWNFILFLSDGWFESLIITFITCGCLFFLSGISLNDNEFKRAFNILIVVSVLLLLQGIYYIYTGWAELDALCVCPIVFLIFIVISAFILLRMDKVVKQ